MTKTQVVSEEEKKCDEIAIAISQLLKSTVCKKKSVLLNATEAADFIGVARSYWYQLNSEGKIPKSVNLNTRVFWNRRELEAWVEAGCPKRHEWEAISNQVTGSN